MSARIVFSGRIIYSKRVGRPDHKMGHNNLLVTSVDEALSARSTSSRC